jgi:serine/threonine protein kinase
MRAPYGTLTPSNVVVRRRNPLQLVLGDMNNAVNDEWRRHPHYRAPETFTDRPPAAAKRNSLAADVWALGAVAAHLALGALPAMEIPSAYPGAARARGC